MRIKTPLLTAAASAAILFAGEASSLASVLVNQSETAPTEDILASFTEDTGNLNWNGYGNGATTWRDIGQTFRASGNTELNAFTLKLNAYGTQALNAAFTITIYEAGSAQIKFSSATLISTQQGNLPNSLEEDQYITFTLDEAVSLTDSKYYTIFLHFDEYGSSSAGGTLRQLIFATGTGDSTNPFGAGSYYWLRPSPFTDAARGNNGATGTGTVLNMYLHGSAAIPEPGTTAYLLGAALAFVVVGGYRYRSLQR